MSNLILVGIGGCFGAIVRYFICKGINRLKFPYGTLTVNLIGSFLLGLIVGLVKDERVILFLATGFMGGLTTFSTVSWEVFQFALNKRWGSFWFYLAITYIVGIGLAYIGYSVGLCINS